MPQPLLLIGPLRLVLLAVGLALVAQLNDLAFGLFVLLVR
jgi:hypothetical protein